MFHTPGKCSALKIMPFCSAQFHNWNTRLDRIGERVPPNLLMNAMAVVLSIRRRTCKYILFFVKLLTAKAPANSSTQLMWHNRSVCDQCPPILTPLHTAHAARKYRFLQPNRVGELVWLHSRHLDGCWFCCVKISRHWLLSFPVILKFDARNAFW